MSLEGSPCRRLRRKAPRRLLDLYAESYVGAIATAREFGEDYNHVGGVDGRFRLGRTHNLSFLAVASEHQDEPNGRLSGPVFELDFGRQARNLSYSVSHSSIDPDFRTATGFVPRVDIRRTDANVAYRWWPEGTLISWGPSFTYLRNYNHAGELEDEQFRGNVNLEFVRNLRFSGGGGSAGNWSALAGSIFARRGIPSSAYSAAGS